MQREERMSAEQYLLKKRRKSIWQRIVIALACVVVFCTTYALILPAITQERDVFCGMEAHTHTEDCYTQLPEAEVIQQICAPEVHTHSDSCLDEEGVVICGQLDYIAHIHNELCVDADGNLRCTLEERETHVHTDACWQTVETVVPAEIHSHTEACITVQRGELVCELPESEEHSHVDACYEQIQTLTCGLEEGAVISEESVQTETVLVCTEVVAQEHVHEEACFQTVIPEAGLTCELEENDAHTHSKLCYGTWILSCEMAEHVHSLACYADLTADVETAEDWEKTFENVELTGAWAEDVLALAQSQLGYQESTKNYVVMEDGVSTRGYTRYGAWYGDPYGDWCAMFTSFCLHYAGVEDMPLDSNCPNWIEKLTEAGLYQSQGTYVPVNGDLIFFDWDANGNPDHVGFVAQVAADEETGVLQISTVEGNNGNRVLNKTYSMDDETILGYGSLPIQLTEEEQIQVDSVIAMIDAMPSADEIDAKIQEFEAAEDYEGEEAWYTEISQQVARAYYEYCQLNEPQKSKVINAGKLLELEYIWSVTTLEDGESIIYYCDKIAHEHDETCYDEEDELVCLKYVHVHSENCLTEPEETVNVEHSVNGVYYHMKSVPYYRASGCMVHNGMKSVVVLSFVLVPDSVVSSPEDNSWTASSAQPVPWSAKNNGNYLVAYCAEPYTDYSYSGESYGSYTIDNSRFTSDSHRRALAGIISHAYPYLTYAEMKAELQAAYEAGELTHNVAACAQCTEHEYMSATQAAIWSLVDSSAKYNNFSTISTDGTARSSKYVNPFQAGYYGHGDDKTLDEHCNEIKNWLLKQTIPEQLAVSSYDYEITETEYGTYNLTVDAEFNRSVISGEIVSVQLVAGDNASDMTVLNAGDPAFRVSLADITEEELLAAEISVTVSGKNLQAYFFDSSESQDFVSGLWEAYEDDISFRLGVESTEVSVSKVWTDGEPENISFVEVQLYANGEVHGEPVRLSAESDWRYIWKNLMRKDVLGNEIRYAVQESQVPGYFSSLELVEGTDAVVTEKSWVPVDRFVEGGQYLIVSTDGALGVQLYNSHPSLTWEAIKLDDVTGTVPMLKWQASGLDENGGAILANLAFPDHPLGITATGNYVYPEGTLKYDGSTAYASQRSELYMDGEGHLYMLNSEGGKQYLTALYVDGEYRTSTDVSKADSFVIYELQTVEVPAPQYHYILKNTGIKTETISVSVEKSWEGRPDGVYPAEVTVGLLQNGYAYGTHVKLTAENQWTAAWTELPLKDNEGNEFTYSVQEIGLDDYTAEITPARDESGNYRISLKNTWTPTYASVEIQKIDGATRSFLSGAEFEVYLTTNNEGVPIPGTTDVYGILVETVNVDESGKVIHEFAVGETYYLVETKAPAGYNLLTEPIGFTVTQRGTRASLKLLNSTGIAETTDGTTAVLTVKNKVGYELPKTGGSGVTLYTMAGLMLMLCSVAFLLYRYQKRRKEVQ